MTKTSFRDVEQLSALLDEKLNPADAARLQKQLENNPELRAIYEDLRQTRYLLRQLPQRRAPRNFTLKPSAVGVRPPLPRIFPVFRLASALASILLFFSLATNATLPRLANMANSAPYAYGMGMGGDPSIDRAMGGGGSAEDAAPEAAFEMAPAAPAVEEPAAEEPSAKTAEPTPSPMVEPTLEVAALPPLDEAQLYQEEQLPAPLPTPEPVAPPIPDWIMIALAVLAFASGGTAFFLRWKSDQQWKIQTTSKK